MWLSVVWHTITEVLQESCVSIPRSSWNSQAVPQTRLMEESDGAADSIHGTVRWCRRHDSWNSQVVPQTWFMEQSGGPADSTFPDKNLPLGNSTANSIKQSFKEFSRTWHAHSAMLRLHRWLMNYDVEYGSAKGLSVEIMALKYYLRNFSALYISTACLRRCVRR
jgi:hypothetical protein